MKRLFPFVLKDKRRNSLLINRWTCSRREDKIKNNIVEKAENVWRHVLGQSGGEGCGVDVGREINFWSTAYRSVIRRKEHYVGTYTHIPVEKLLTG